MSVSANRRVRAASGLGALCAAILAAAAPAYAQSAPVSLLPAPGAAPADAPADGDPLAVPDGLDPDGGPGDAVPADAPASPAISSSALEAPSTDRIGLMDAAAGGFPADMWRGTDLDLLRRILPQLPRRMDSLAQRRLARGLLLSAAAPPSASSPPASSVIGEDPVPGAGPPSQWLLETRLIGLAAIGDWDDALALMDLVPAGQMTDGLRKLRADGSLVTGRINDACGAAQESLAATGDAYWQKLQVFCSYANDQASAASFGLSVLREQGVQDPLFFWAVDLLNGSRPLSPPNPGRAEPLHLAMLARAGVAVPEALIQDGDPTALAVIAGIAPAEDKADRTPAAQRAERRKAQEEARVLVAERAVAAGTLDAERLRLLYRQLNVKDEPAPALAAVTVATVRERVHLFQTALNQAVPAARAEVIARVIDLTRADRGRQGPDLVTVGQVYAPLIREIEPSADLVWFAGTAARALIAAGETDAGRPWLGLARSMARTSIEAGLVADGLRPIERLVEPAAGRMPPRMLQAWRATVASEARPHAQAVLFNLLAALGEPVTAADWLPVMGEAPARETVRATPAHVINGLDLAARGKRVGETAAFALLALGEDGLAAVEPAAAREIVRGLVAAGRESDARALVAEALLVEGL